MRPVPSVLEPPSWQPTGKLIGATESIAHLYRWVTDEDRKVRLDATRWIGPDGRYQPWTKRPWFDRMRLGTPWGRFLLLGLAAGWNFNKPFEKGEAFILWWADRHAPGVGGTMPLELRHKLQRYWRETRKPDAVSRAAAAEQLGLLTPDDFLALKRYEQVVTWLENPARQSELPERLVSDLQAGRVTGLQAMLADDGYGLTARLKRIRPDEKTLALDFLTALAAIAEQLDELDQELTRPGKVTPTRLAALIARLDTLRAVFLTRKPVPSLVIKVKLPLVLRELAAHGVLEVDDAFCCVPDSHVRRQLRTCLQGRSGKGGLMHAAGNNPGLNRAGIQAAEAILRARFGPEGLSPVPVNGTPGSPYELLLVSALVHALSPHDPYLYDLPLFRFSMASPGNPPPSEKAPNPGQLTLVERIRLAVEQGALPEVWTTADLVACPAIAPYFAVQTLRTDPPNRSVSPCGNHHGHWATNPATAPYVRFPETRPLRYCLKVHHVPAPRDVLA